MKHKAVIIIGLILLSFAAAKVVQAQDGYIQIVSEPGVAVFLNGELQGVTSTDFGGLIIQNVTAGSHTIRLVREGFNPQEERITLRAGQVYVHTVRPFVPAMRITQEGEEGGQEIDLQVGSLKIQSLPVAIKIAIPELEVESNKERDIWRADDMPVGNYSAVFTLGNSTIEHEIAISQNQQTHLFVNMVENRVDTISSTPTAVTPVRDDDENAINDVEDEEPEIFTIVEQMPELIGGMQSIYEILRYPEKARRDGIEGSVVLQFIIDKQGKVVDPVVVRGIGGGCDEAAIEAVKQVRFTPGRQGGRVVRTRYSLPITFRP